MPQIDDLQMIELLEEQAEATLRFHESTERKIGYLEGLAYAASLLGHQLSLGVASPNRAAVTAVLELIHEVDAPAPTR